MSFTLEGSRDGECKDELDLGRQDEDLRSVANGQARNGDHEQSEEGADKETITKDESQDAAEGDGSAILSGSEEVLSVQHHLPDYTIEAAGETASIPDDTPSLHESLQSAPSSSAFVSQRSPRVSPSPSHRPFDLRFQSRLSSSLVGNLRPGSPYIVRPHSRQSSFASQAFSFTTDSEVETSQPPWDVVRWTKLRKITSQAFSEIGRPVESGSVTSLAISADHSTIAGGHVTGDIFTWELSRSARPFLYIPAIPSNQNRKPDGHLSGVSVVHLGFLGTRRTALVSADGRGMAFSHLATRGMGAVGRTVKTTRILGRYPEQPVQNDRPRKPSSVLAFSPLPLGNINQPTDSLGLVAMLTPYLLVIVSTTPVAQTQHKSARLKEVASHSVLTAALAWFPAIRLKGKDEISKTKLVYCWSNVLTVLDVSEADSGEENRGDRPPILDFRPRSRWRAKEAIVAVQWLSRSVLAILTITQQLLILEDPSLHVTDSFDLIHKHIYHIDMFSTQLQMLVEQYNEDDASMHGVVGDAFYMSFRAYKGRLFLLGYNDMSVGSLSNWADRLLAFMEAGDFIAAIQLAASYYSGDAEKLTVGLPEDDDSRHMMVKEKLFEMISASLKYAFGRNREASMERLGMSQLGDLADASIAACVCVGDEGFLWDEVYNWYEAHDSEGIFLDVLEPYILRGSTRSLPPTAIKALINHFATNHASSRLEEIICLLDTKTMDIEQAIILCKQHNLYDAFIYVWNRTLGDYIGPLIDLIELAGHLATPQVIENSDGGVKNYNNAMKMFPYLSFTLTGRVYPTGDGMDDAEAAKAKASLYTYLFSGNQVLSNENTPHVENSYESLRKILEFDSSSFMSMLNEAFEDSFLNEASDVLDNVDSRQLEDISSRTIFINRQYLLSILLEVMSSLPFGPADTIYLDMFIARNLPKYTQYILLPGTTLHQVLVRLCNYPSEELAEDCELSVEYLLSIYHPPDVQTLIPIFKEAQFFRILKSTYRSEKQFAELLLVYLEDSNDQKSVFTCIQDCLRPGSGLSNKQRRDVLQVVKSRANQLANIDVVDAAQTIENFALELHESFLHALGGDELKQYQYLATLLQSKTKLARENDSSPREVENWMVERYVQLMCKYDPTGVADFVDGLQAGDLRLDEVLHSLEHSGVVDAAVILLARQGQVRNAMDRLTGHLGTLESGLMGILRNVDESPDSLAMAEAVNDLVSSLDKYSRVGTWLCQGQMKTTKRARNDTKNGRRISSIFQSPLSLEESLWLDLIDTVVRVVRNVTSFVNMERGSFTSLDHDNSQLTSTLRALVQHVFTALLTSTTKAGGPVSSERTDVAFLRILRAFLTRAASWSPSLSELRAVLASIFSAYTYEESLLSLANGMLDKDLFVHVDEVTRLRQQGWRPRGQICEICRRRVWGPGAGAKLWEAWERRQAEGSRNRQAKRLASMVNPAISGGKGKAAVGSCEAGSVELPYRFDNHFSGGGVSDGGEEPSRPSTTRKDDDADPGLVVVFACRHLYHRQCLLNAPGPSHNHAPGLADSSAELFCPACI
ncbi:hypothetical protein Egran_04330 [Elaphomyces granulatus]|uniref:Uncharacterized protein n=1 Tax=Elaphomyces granulatus TaxID=519963 RepID=A0A232LUW2_9EURO|nr:hypothetical protein Egran_04330 [Elaphomyces granulatus]